MQIYKSPRPISALSASLLLFFLSMAIAKPVSSQALSLSNIRGAVSIQGTRAGLWKLLPSINVFGLFSNSALDANKVIRVPANGQATLECANRQKYVLNSGDHPVSKYCPQGNVRNTPRSGSLGGRSPIDRVIFVASQTNEDFPGLGNTAFLNLDSLFQQHPNLANLENNSLTVDGYREKPSDISEIENTVTTPYAEGTIEFVESLMVGGYYYYPYGDTAETPPADASFAFNILSAAESAKVLEQVAVIKAQGLGADEQAIALAMLYLNYEYQADDPGLASFGLNSLALETLNERINEGSENLVLHLLQAEAYTAMGSLDEAKLAYEVVLSLAADNGQLEYQAAIHELLGDIANAEIKMVTPSETKQIKYHWQAALFFYQQLDNQEKIGVIQSKLISN